jgi:hypothetical protein
LDFSHIPPRKINNCLYFWALIAENQAVFIYFQRKKSIMSSLSNQTGVLHGDAVQELFEIAKKNQFALPAVNVTGTNTVNAVLEAAKAVNSPTRIKQQQSLVPSLAHITFTKWRKHTVFKWFCTQTTARKNYCLGSTVY